MLLGLFGIYLIGMAIFGFIWAGIARPGSFMLLATASLSTTYMGFSVLDYRSRILHGGRYPASLRIFQLFYWVLTIPLFLLLAPLHSLMKDFVDRLASLLFLSLFYAPIDLVFRLRRSGRAGHDENARAESHVE